MQRHGINSVAVVVCSQRRSHDAGGASGLHVPAHAVKLDGKRSSRNAAAARAARPRTAHSTPAAGTAWPKNLPRNPHRAGPRAARALPRWARPGPALAAPAARAVTPALGLPLLLAVRRGPITPCRLPASPLAGRFPTRLAAIALQRMGRLEGLLTSLQQADAHIATGRLTRRVGWEILRWAHGRSCSQRSSLGGELRTRRRGVFIGSVTSA